MTANPLTIAIVGVPAPQGSKTGVVRGNRAILIEGGSQTGRDKHRAWRDACAAAAGRRGLIVKTGEMRRSTRRHGTPQWLWVGTHVTDLEAGAA